MCIKKVACGLQKIKREDGREVLEPIFVEVDCPEDMHRITSKIESCKTVTPKIVEENTQEVGLIQVTVQNEQGGEHVGHGGVTVIGLPNDIGSPITGKVSTDSKEVSTDNKKVSTDSKEVSTDNKEVVCIETGEVFSSIRQASKSINVDPSSITKCCKGKRKTAGGYHWQYL